MDLPAYVTEYRQARKELEAEFHNNKDPFYYIRNHTAAADKAIQQIVMEVGLSPRISVVALGGFGRRELFPYSDLDVLFLLPDKVLDNELKQVEEVLNSLWSLGLTVGYSVRSIEECLEQAGDDITAETAMLESRLICGNPQLYENYLEALRKHLDYVEFFRRKFIEQQQRHLKFQGSSLEPNIKESPGGLRDLNILSWILKAWKITSQEKHASETALLTDSEREAIEKAISSLFWLRINMHLLAGRHEDRLIFEIQDDLAKKLGIEAAGEQRASEVLMQRFYRNASTVSNLNSVILQAALEQFNQPTELEGKDIGDGFVIKGDTLDITSPEIFKQGPFAFILPFYFKIKYPEIAKFSVGILRTFENLDAFSSEQYLADKRAKELFLEILKAKTGTYHTLREMARWGVLSKLLPAWARITGQMQYDLFHAYTVDQHSILAVRYLRHFTRVENAHEMPLCSNLMMGLKDNWRVVVAMLFHDVGKGSGRDHSIVGAEKVREFGRTFGLKEEDIDYISFLVKEHLTMSQVAQKQDISDPEVVKQFAAKVGDLDRLSGLYLQTVCDIRATSPKIWNGWKARLLEQLYYASAEYLKGTSLSKNMLVGKRRDEVLKQLTLNPEEQQELINFWKEFDVAYFMRHSEESILWHANVLQGHFDKMKSFVATRRVDGVPNAHEILVLTQDKPELFASIVSAFQFLDLSIVEARIHTGKTGRVLDTFLVIDDGSRHDIDEDLEELTRSLAIDLDQDAPLPPLGRSRISRQSKFFPITPNIQLRPDADGTQFLLSIVAADRRGLLAAISRVFVKFNINLVTARIATLGDRVEDVFLIKNPLLHEAPIAAQFEGEVLKVLELPT